ncbi:MAG: sugar phosphate nucleotidyltransferase [Verrucomicrobia bacterium]|nr:sugar phosphate nucleotidyltransferase [Verrucomicrobiota bacterium]
MKIKKAVITAAGRNQRHLPLQTLVDREGFPRSALNLLIEEITSAGIQDIGIVIAPGDEQLYKESVDVTNAELTFIVQKKARGYGHAIHRAKDFLEEEPFLLMVSDHLYVSDAESSCARQLVEIAEKVQSTVSAVQATHEGKLTDFGAVGGTLSSEGKNLYAIDTVLEKPTPTQAEQQILVPGLRTAHYLCFFGMHILTPKILSILGDLLEGADAKPSLSDALQILASQEQYLASLIRGRRYDLENRYGMLTAQMALALDSKHREEVLSQLVELLAESKRRETDG